MMLKSRSLRIAAVALIASLACSKSQPGAEEKKQAPAEPTPPAKTESAAASPTPSTTPSGLSLKEAEEIVARENIDVAEPELVIGSKAPKLYVESWLSGKGAIEPGRPTVVELWATWCRPCIEAMPHLSQMHDEGIAVVAVNIEPDNREGAKKLVEKYRKHIRYPVGHDASKKMIETWIEAAALPGLPATFLVDRDGRITWLGHPNDLPRALKAVLEGKWDAEAEAQYNRNKRLAEPFTKRAKELLESDPKRAYELIAALLVTVLREQPKELANLALHILSAPNVAKRDPQIAYRLTIQSCEITKWKEPTSIELASRIAEAAGDLPRALEFQKRAVAAGKGAPRFRARLAKLMEKRGKASQ